MVPKVAFPFWGGPYDGNMIETEAIPATIRVFEPVGEVSALTKLSEMPKSGRHIGFYNLKRRNGQPTYVFTRLDP